MYQISLGPVTNGKIEARSAVAELESLLVAQWIPCAGKGQGGGDC